MRDVKADGHWGGLEVMWMMEWTVGENVGE